MHGGPRAWIYWTILAMVAAALGALPVTTVDVTVRASGMARPATERVELKPVLGGMIAELLARDNDAVVAGQPLLRLAGPELDERIERNRVLRAQATDLMHDLTLLAAAASTEVAEENGVLPAAAAAGSGLRQVLRTAFRTAVLREEHARLVLQMEAGALAEARARLEFERASALASKGIATQRELDDARYALERTRTETRAALQQAVAGWQARLREEQQALEALHSEGNRLGEERTRTVVRAPVAGTVLGLTGLSHGSYIAPGQVIGAISPDDRLVVEALAAGRAIGLVRIGQKVKLQVDAYPYTEWGMLDGTVAQIAGDAISVGAAGSGSPAQPFFRVLIEPAGTALRLPNGTAGEIKKGHSVNARFLVARRSLLQMLYDDLSAWLDPHAAQGSK